LVIKRVRQPGGGDKLFLRYQVDYQIFSGYTVQNPANRVTSSPTKFHYLDQGLDRDNRVCRHCNEKFSLRGHDRSTYVCPDCLAKHQAELQAKKLAAQRYCQTEGCNRPISRDNKTGLCRHCFRHQGDFAAVSGGFNPFYGRIVKARRKALEQSDDQDTGTKN
jgi:ribosomal protein S14